MIKRFLGRLTRHDDCILQVAEGSAVLVVLPRYSDVEIRATTASVALARRGVPLRLARVAIAAAAGAGGYPMTVPKVEGISVFKAELNAAGIDVLLV